MSNVLDLNPKLAKVKPQTNALQFVFTCKVKLWWFLRDVEQRMFRKGLDRVTAETQAYTMSHGALLYSASDKDAPTDCRCKECVYQP